MAIDGLKDIYLQHRETSLKLTYFYLAAAGACIGLVLNRTQSLTMEYNQVFLAAAVLNWAASFFSGCKYITYTHMHQATNARNLVVKSGTDPQVGKDPTKIHETSEALNTLMDRHSTTAAKCHRWQFRFLIYGGVLYITWHVVDMYCRTLLAS